MTLVTVGLGMMISGNLTAVVRGCQCPSLHALSGAMRFLYKLMCAALFTCHTKKKN